MKLNIGQTVDRYTVERQLGHGGTALVYLVLHTRLGTRHALKVLTVTSPAIKRRMEREGQVQASLRHPNIVLVSDILDVEGNPGLLMEFIEGPSLEEALKKYKFTMGDAEMLFNGIVSGVKAAHKRGLVHRDLKPANVLLERTRQGVVPKVTDFGLAKMLESDDGVHHTRSGIAMGTPSYMAPEQIRDARTVDERADIWSLGCLLYELITRRRAFPGEEALEIYNKVCAGDFEAPRKLLDDLPDRIEQAIHGALRVDRDDRIPDCETLMAVLRGEQAWPLPAEEYEEARSGPILRGGSLHQDRPAMQVASRPAKTPPPAPPRTDLGPALGQQVVSSESSSPSSGHDEPSTVVLPNPRRSVDGTLAPTDSMVERSLADDDGGWGWVTWAIVAVMLIGVGLAALVGTAGVVGGVWLGTGSGTSETVVNEVEARQPARAMPTAPGTAPADDEVAADEGTDEVTEPEPEPAPAPRPTPRPTPRPSPQRAAPAPAPAPAPAAAPQPAPAPQPGVFPPRPEPAPEDPAAADAPVEVKILSQPPAADVNVDGRPDGRTPRKVELLPGRHVIILNSGGQEGSFVINVEPDGETRWCWSFAHREAYAGPCQPQTPPGTTAPTP